MLDFGSAPTNVVEVVLTGGSCAGKTTALALVSQALREKGMSVLTVPEAVTLLVTGGVPSIGEISRNDLHRGCLFQRQVFATQRNLRRSFRHLADLFLTDTVVILSDRGELDALAYHRHGCVPELAALEGTSLDEIRDSYSAVIHLVTAANGAEHAYQLHRNPARWDTPEEACAYDTALLQAWSGHRRHIVIDNSTDFVGKMERLVQAVTAIAEEPEGVSLVGHSVPALRVLSAD